MLTKHKIFVPFFNFFVSSFCALRSLVASRAVTFLNTTACMVSYRHIVILSRHMMKWERRTALDSETLGSLSGSCRI